MLGAGWAGERAREKMVGALGSPTLATLGSSLLSPSQASCVQSAPSTPEPPGGKLTLLLHGWEKKI